MFQHLLTFCKHRERKSNFFLWKWFNRNEKSVEKLQPLRTRVDKEWPKECIKVKRGIKKLFCLLICLIFGLEIMKKTCTRGWKTFKNSSQHWKMFLMKWRSFKFGEKCTHFILLSTMFRQHLSLFRVTCARATEQRQVSNETSFGKKSNIKRKTVTLCENLINFSCNFKRKGNEILN